MSEIIIIPNTSGPLRRALRVSTALTRLANGERKGDIIKSMGISRERWRQLLAEFPTFKAMWKLEGNTKDFRERRYRANNWQVMESVPGERWKQLTGGYDRYYISTTGRLYNEYHAKVLNGNVFSPNGDEYTPYRRYVLTDKNTGKISQLYAHRLVAAAFLPNPEGKRTVNHIDGDGLNNNLDNLEWATHSENRLHGARRIET